MPNKNKVVKIWRDDRCINQHKPDNHGRISDSLGRSYQKYGQTVKPEDVSRGHGGVFSTGGNNVTDTTRDHAVYDFDGNRDLAGRVVKGPKGQLRFMPKGMDQRKLGTVKKPDEKWTFKREMVRDTDDAVAAYCRKHGLDNHRKG